MSKRKGEPKKKQVKSNPVTTSELTPQQLRFCEEYLIDLNGKQAAIRAGYSEDSATQQASRLLTYANVSAKITELTARRSARAAINADQILAELSRIGYTDIRSIFKDDGTIKDVKDWPEDLARAIASVEVLEEYDGSGKDRTWIGFTKKVKFWDKPRALELMGKHKALFPNKFEHSGKVTLEELVSGSIPKKTEDGNG